MLLLENLRFHAGETANDPAFAAALAALADVYVNDAFGAAHRAHASTEGVAHLLPRAAGLLLRRELEVLGGLLDAPEHPFVVIAGGVKVADKIGVLETLAERADAILIGGAMAFTFAACRRPGDRRLAARGRARARPRRARAVEACARARLRAARCPPTSSPGARSRPTPRSWCSPFACDPATAGWASTSARRAAQAYAARASRRARTVFWNGPMGAFELAPFAAGTLAVAEAVAACPGHTVVGGGDSVAAVHAGRPGRSHRSRLDRRRREPRAARGRTSSPASPRCPPEESRDGRARRSSQATGRCTRRAGRRPTTAQEVAAAIDDLDEVDLAICPPFTAIDVVAERARRRAASVSGARTMHDAPRGRVHGRDVVRACSIDAGASGVLLGHSERRALFGETDEALARKVAAALAAGLEPVLCIGETEHERDGGATVERACARSSTASLGELDASQALQVTIAYEPVWAIGTGRTRHARDGAGGARRSSARAGSPTLRRGVRGGRAHPLRRLGQARQRAASCSRCPTSTARSSAARASAASLARDRAARRSPGR